MWLQLSNKFDSNTTKQGVSSYLSKALIYQNQFWVMDLGQQQLYHLTTGGSCNKQKMPFGK